MSDFKVFELDVLIEQAGGSSYREFIRRPGVSISLQVLPTGGVDRQRPHDSDTVYVVLDGKAVLRVEDTQHEVHAGSVVAVDRGVDRNFHNIAEDLHVLVIFAPSTEPQP